MSNTQNAPAVLGPVERQVRPGAEARPLVERLRSGVYGTNRIPLCAEAADEIERLRKVLILAQGALSMSNPCAMPDCRAEQMDWKSCAMQEIEKALKA